ncbi:hypothetical protein P280DRAFT_546200 [Massarina eburnea CBS 473.64]|uniref:DUF7704 domain-containing protein n=1 Tax=Massarina eburnea CBS 473.64 TaxID=1395130 RepID=A0A6A6SAH7_9PLEO|nr:hypothetical protein P280DRAFT_546200 [Massarina eburnea CBS 473.64]
MALGTNLPFWPALVFSYLEPLALFFGAYDAFKSPSNFVSRQYPTATSLVPESNGAIILAYTLANIFVLLAFLAIVCTAISRDSRVTKYYLLFVAVADLGHICASHAVMGKEMLLDFNVYNDVMWGNIGASAFLHVNRLATLLGVFGRVGR